MPTVETNGIETYYEEQGDGPPIVFVHGSGWDHRQWTPQLDGLADDYETIAYDVRGHGETGGSDREEVTFRVLADDLAELVEALELEDPTLVGLSMGGRIAHVCAATHPDLPGSLVTYEAPYRNEPLSLSAPVKVLRSVYLGVYRFLGPLRAYYLFRWYRTRFGEQDGVIAGTEPIPGLGMTKREYIQDAISRVNRHEQLKISRSFGNEIDDPSTIAVPTLVLTGDRPDSINLEDAEQLAAEIPDARKETIPDAGHAGNIDNPEVFNEALGKFLADQGITTATAE